MFNPIPELCTFVQLSALIKTARWLGYDKASTFELIKDNIKDLKKRISKIYLHLTQK